MENDLSRDISVIICCYSEKRRNDLADAIASVQSQTLQCQEMIVVIDHNPALLAWVREHFPEVIAIENKEVRGLSGARNSGVAIARGDILAFLDDDAVADPHWLMLLNETFSDPNILGAGGSILPLWLEKRPAWLPEEFYWVVGCTYLGMPQKVSQVRNLIGANMAFRREIFERAGGFRNEIGRRGTIPLGCEETELCIRARQLWPQRYFLYQPAATVFHKVPGTRARWTYFFSRCYSEGISKAFVARYVGTKDGLASERVYTLYTLPLGTIHGLKDAFYKRELAGFARVLAILTGLAATATGYVSGIAFPPRQKVRAQIRVIPEFDTVGKPSV